MSETTLVRDVTINVGSLTLTGDVVYDDEQSALVLLDAEDGRPERLSINLSSYGLICEPGHVYVKDWSEGEGLAQQLVTAGVGAITREAVVGPFRSRAYLLKINR